MPELPGSKYPTYNFDEQVDWIGVGIKEKPSVKKMKRVHEPTHYDIFPDMQVIDVIKETLSKEEFIGFCKGNILKYRLRDKDNNIEEDFEKSNKYKSYLRQVDNR